MNTWDPIGCTVALREAGHQPNEYEAYVGRVLAILKADAPVEVLARELARICADELGVAPGLRPKGMASEGGSRRGKMKARSIVPCSVSETR